MQLHVALDTLRMLLAAFLAMLGRLLSACGFRPASWRGLHCANCMLTCLTLARLFLIGMPSPARGTCRRAVTGNSVSLERAFGGAGLPPPSTLRQYLAPEYAARYEKAGAAASHGTVLHHDKSANGTRHHRRCYEAVTAVVNKRQVQPELLASVDYSPPPPAERRPRADEVQRLAPTRGPQPAAELSLENARIPYGAAS